MTTLTILILTFLFVSIIEAVNKYTPTWITSNYIKSDCADVISNKTGNASQPSATIPFPGSAFTQVPNIGYGAFNYQGNNILIIGDDGLASEMFEINRTDVTTSSFSVLIQITGYTNINKMTVRFVAIDKDFPHHVNSYDNVPANYSAGPFVNISDQTPNINRYENIINFT